MVVPSTATWRAQRPGSRLLEVNRENGISSLPFFKKVFELGNWYIDWRIYRLIYWSEKAQDLIPWCGEPQPVQRFFPPQKIIFNLKERKNMTSLIQNSNLCYHPRCSCLTKISKHLKDRLNLPKYSSKANNWESSSWYPTCRLEEGVKALKVFLKIFSFVSQPSPT